MRRPWFALGRSATGEKYFFKQLYLITLNVGEEKCRRLYGGKLIFKYHLNEWEKSREESPEGPPKPLKYSISIQTP